MLDLGPHPGRTHPKRKSVQKRDNGYREHRFIVPVLAQGQEALAHLQASTAMALLQLGC